MNLYHFPNAHIVALYDVTSEISDVITEFICNSIDMNFCTIFIEGDTETEQIISGLKHRLNYDQLIKDKKLLLIKATGSYAKDGFFSPQKMVTLLKRQIKESLKNGFSGLALTGEISWTLNYDDGEKRVFDYECLLNEEVFPEGNITSICRYNINRFPDEMLVNVIEAHPFLIWKNQIHENPFYINIEKYHKEKISNYRVKTWLENISKFTCQKSEFANVFENHKQAINKIQANMTDALIHSMTYLLEKHNKYTENHSKKVAILAKEISEKNCLSPIEITNCYYAGIVHDIGKILISNAILDKKEALNAEEYKAIKEHPVNGYETLKDFDILKNVSIAVLHHHERWDGKGYPKALKGDEIPLLSRILAIADTYDAMTSKRAYRKAFTHSEALKEIYNCAGTQFDPNIVKSFLEIDFDQISEKIKVGED